MTENMLLSLVNYFYLEGIMNTMLRSSICRKYTPICRISKNWIL